MAISKKVLLKSCFFVVFLVGLAALLIFRYLFVIPGQQMKECMTNVSRILIEQAETMKKMEPERDFDSEIYSITDNGKQYNFIFDSQIKIAEFIEVLKKGCQIRFANYLRVNDYEMVILIGKKNYYHVGVRENNGTLIIGFRIIEKYYETGTK